MPRLKRGHTTGGLVVVGNTMGRAFRGIGGVLLLLFGGVLGLYGVLDILYTENGSDNAYVDFGNTRVDADIVGAISLVVAFCLLATSLVILRKR
jgi:hypothetical protein